MREPKLDYRLKPYKESERVVGGPDLGPTRWVLALALDPAEIKNDFVSRRQTWRDRSKFYPPSPQHRTCSMAASKVHRQ